MTINSPFAYLVPFATMTDLVTSPDAANHAGVAEVTPGGVIAARLAMADRFDPELISVIARIIDPTGTTSDDVIVGIEALFVTHWKAKSWSDLRVFNAGEVEKAIFSSGLQVPTIMTEPVVCKKLEYIVDYAKIGKLTPGISMDEIVDYVTDAKTKPTTKTTNRDDPRLVASNFSTRKLCQLSRNFPDSMKISSHGANRLSTHSVLRVSDDSWTTSR